LLDRDTAVQMPQDGAIYKRPVLQTPLLLQPTDSDTVTTITNRYTEDPPSQLGAFLNKSREEY